jgi:hypothetical protein
MKKEPSYSPKYWAGHDSSTDDLIIGTMFKYRQDTYDQMVSLYGEDWEDEFPHLKVDLVELSIVPVQIGHSS